MPTRRPVTQAAAQQKNPSLDSRPIPLLLADTLLLAATGSTVPRRQLGRHLRDARAVSDQSAS